MVTQQVYLIHDNCEDIYSHMFSKWNCSSIKNKMTYYERDTIDESKVIHLSICIERGPEYIDLLNNYGVNVISFNNYKFNVLEFAVKYCSLTFVKYLLDNDIDINKYGKDALRYSINWSKGIDICKLLVEHGITIEDVHMRDACINKEHEIIEYFISNGIVPKVSNIFDVFYGYNNMALSCLKLLLDTGISINCINNKGETLLERSINTYDMECAIYLINNGININHKNNKGNTVIITLLNKNGNINIIEELLKKGIDINAFNPKGKTPLFHAIAANNLDYVKLLINYGAYCITKSQNIINYQMQRKNYGNIDKYNKVKDYILRVKNIKQYFLNKTGVLTMKNFDYNYNKMITLMLIKKYNKFPLLNEILDHKIIPFLFV